MKSEKILRWWTKLLLFLRVKSVHGGLEISDQVLRLVYSRGEEVWQTAAVRLEPGVLEGGVVKDRPALVTGLRALKTKIVGPHEKGNSVNVVVALSSANIYSQAFSLPVIEDKSLDTAVELNLQMLSPMDLSRAYYSSQFLGRDEKTLRMELLAAFVEKSIVDDLTSVLFDSGFFALAVESRSLALARLVREQGSGIDPEGSYLFLDVDNSGLDFLIIRKGSLYFEYTTRWADLMDQKGEISMEKFKETLAGSLRQVVNFYSQHWPEPLAGTILSAGAFKEESEEIVKAATSVPVIPLVPTMAGSLSPEWFVALGCGLRPTKPGVEQLNLIGGEAAVAFRDQQILHFTNLWRVAIPASFLLLLVTFGLADSFLLKNRAELESGAQLQTQGSQIAEINELEASATAFNQSVSLLAGIESSIQPKYTIVADLASLASMNGVAITHITFASVGSSVLLSGTADSETAIVGFKTAVQTDPRFGAVDLPLTNIVPSGSGFTFTMDFPLSASAFQ